MCVRIMQSPEIVAGATYIVRGIVECGWSRLLALGAKTLMRLLLLMPDADSIKFAKLITHWLMS